MESHSVACLPAEVTFLPLPQPIKASTRFNEPRGLQGWVDLVDSAVTSTCMCLCVQSVTLTKWLLMFSLLVCVGLCQIHRSRSLLEVDSETRRKHVADACCLKWEVLSYVWCILWEWFSHIVHKVTRHIVCCTVFIPESFKLFIPCIVYRTLNCCWRQNIFTVLVCFHFVAVVTIQLNRHNSMCQLSFMPLPG